MKREDLIGAMNNLIRMAVAVVGLSLFVFIFAFFWREATKVASWRASGVSNSDIRPDSTGTNPVFQRVDSADFGRPPYPVVGNKIVRIADSAATTARWGQFFDTPGPAGSRTDIEWVNTKGDTVSNFIVERLPSGTQVRDVVILQILRFLVAFFFVGVGLWAFFARPNLPAVRTLAMFCFAMGSFMMAAVHALSGSFATMQIPYLDQILQVINLLSLFFGPFWLHLNLLFPRPLELIERKPWLPLLYPYSLHLILFVWIRFFSGDNLALMIHLIATAVEVGIGFTILGYRRNKAQNLLERRQANLVLWGAGIGLGTLVILVVLVTVLGKWFAAHPQFLILVINVAFLGLLVVPVSFAYAFGRWRLLDIEARLRRGTRYVLITGLLVVLLVVASVGIGLAVGTNFANENRFIVAMAALAIGTFIMPVRKIQEAVERRVYPERERLRQLIRDFLQRALSLPDKESFWDELENRLRSGLLVETVHPVMRAHRNGGFIYGRGLDTPFELESDFVLGLQRESRPILVDEVLASSRVRVRDAEASWFVSNDVALVLPLVAQNKLVGFLGLGRKSEHEDYSAEELRILNSLAPQIALASENMRLIEENVEKQRLEEQMRMARLIQQGFLPHDLPPTPGLEFATRSRFSLEVAGDYYDVIPLENGATVIAVGDVSGKGAGAALLMANLQASLRTAVDVGVPLAGIVARVNELIYRNTPPEQYITFFVSIYDPTTRELTYVNAGHNAPVVVRASGECELLETGGLILGCLSGVVYEQATIQIRPSDLVAFYTDGVSEAMNADGEEFGDKQVHEFVCKFRNRSAEEIARELEAAVIVFQGREQFDDDFTLMVVRGM